MSKKSDGFKLFLTLSAYISSFIFMLSAVYAFIEIYKGNEIPVRIIILQSIAIITWFIIAYYSDEASWKTLLKLFCYSLALLSLCLSMFGLTLILNVFTKPETQVNITMSLAYLVLGGVMTFSIAKLLGSKWLN